MRNIKFVLLVFIVFHSGDISINLLIISFKNFQMLCDIDSYFRKQPSLIDTFVPETSKFTICGDIHGQFYDLMNIFKINGLPSPSNRENIIKLMCIDVFISHFICHFLSSVSVAYLFNGDFVDRGSFSVECIFTLFGFKLLYPDHFFLSRGNHESYNMNQMYGFSGEF